MKNLLAQFISFEKNEKLFDLTIGEIMIWDYIRSTVYSTIRRQNLNIKYTKQSLKEKPIKSLLGMLKHLVFILRNLNLFSVKGKKNILVLGHPRRQRQGKFFEDIYTDILVKKLSEKFSIVSLELPLGQSHLRPINMNEVKYLDPLELGQTFSPYFNRFKISETEKSTILKIEERISAEFNVRINLLKVIKEHLIKYHYVYKRVTKKIERLSPKVIITVDGYNFTKKIFTEIANKKKIQTIELQHGTMGSEHLAYNFPDGVAPDSFPSNLFSWGEYWHLDTQLPETTQVYNVGFPYMENQKNKVNLMNQKETNILVSSQWTIGFELMEYINLFAEGAQDYNFIVKLHPLEFDSIDSFVELALHSNISFVTDEMNIYNLFSICKTHIGVYSTTLSEGLAFNLKTLIVPLSGHEMYLRMIDQGYMSILNSSTELNNFLKKETEKRSLEEVWVSDALENITGLIEKKIIS